MTELPPYDTSELTVIENCAKPWWFRRIRNFSAVDTGKTKHHPASAPDTAPPAPYPARTSEGVDFANKNLLMCNCDIKRGFMVSYPSRFAESLEEGIYAE